MGISFKTLFFRNGTVMYGTCQSVNGGYKLYILSTDCLSWRLPSNFLASTLSDEIVYFLTSVMRSRVVLTLLDSESDLKGSGSTQDCTTVIPLITNTLEEFIKCRLYNISMIFILYYVNFSICENK